MIKQILAKFSALALCAAVFLGGVMFMPQNSQARDDDFMAPGRLLGSGQATGDGSDMAIDGPPGALDTGRYTSSAHKEGKSSGLIQGGGFSVNLTNPQTHGHSDDVGAKAGWSWSF